MLTQPPRVVSAVITTNAAPPTSLTATLIAAQGAAFAIRILKVWLSADRANTGAIAAALQSPAGTLIDGWSMPIATRPPPFDPPLPGFLCPVNSALIVVHSSAVASQIFTATVLFQIDRV